MEFNFVEVLIAAVASMVVGFLWYSPMVLGKQWMKEKGLTPDKLKKAQSEMGKLYGLSFVVAMISAYVLSHVMRLSMNYYSYSEMMTGVTTAFWMWLGFMMPVQLTEEIFGNKNWKLFMINTGYQLVSLIVMGIVISMV